MTFAPFFRFFVPFSLVLRLETVYTTPYPYYLLVHTRCPPRPAPQIQQAYVLHMNHKTCEQNMPLTHYRLDGFIPRRLEIVVVGDRVVSAIAIPPSDAAS